ncbi:hypothetical protein HFO39_22945 [Rhizobium leguminosarum]|uniref:TRIC cation channel family protein n=1 Tax=Rhizobium leguminosarum TaxID=384 RepID=UPI001C938821|nr:TRIC cation channel family protein [Rhizobium leguminosarum]MBY5637588.1 hypothetical protein [Rhizobium leguminosarum]
MVKIMLFLVMAVLTAIALAQAQFPVSLLSVLNLAATVVFSLAGGLIMRASFVKISPDAVIAIFAAGFLTANGGGTMRDFALGQAPFWLFDIGYLLISALTTVLILVIRNFSTPGVVGVIAMADDFSTGVFVATGVIKVASWLPLDSQFFMLAAALSGFVTGLGGGILRDCLLLRRRPVAFTAPCLLNVSVCSGLLAVLTTYHLLPAFGLDTIETETCMLAGLIVYGNRVTAGITLLRSISDGKLRHL